MIRAKLGDDYVNLYPTGIFYRKDVREAFNKMLATFINMGKHRYWSTEYQNSKELEEIRVRITFDIPEGFSEGCVHKNDLRGVIINVTYNKVMKKIYFYENDDNSATYNVDPITFKEILDHIDQHYNTWISYAKDYTINSKNLQTNIMLDLPDIIEHVEQAFGKNKIKCSVEEDLDIDELLDTLGKRRCGTIDFELYFDSTSDEYESVTFSINNTIIDPDTTKFKIDFDYDSKFGHILKVTGDDNNEFGFNTYEELNDIVDHLVDILNYVNNSFTGIKKYLNNDED